MPRDHRTILDNHAEGAVRRYWQVAERLPEPGEKWLAREADIDTGALKLFQRSGVIEKHEREDGPGDCHYWETSEGVREFVEQYIEGKTRTPCGRATGVRTITAGEEYTCTDPECDCRMDRKTAEEVVA